MKNLARLVASKRKAAPKPKRPTLIGVSSFIARNAALYRALMLVQQRVATAHGNRDDFQQTKRLREIVAKEGFSRSLVALVNADGSASKIFANFPALEALDTVGLGSNTRRCRLALEGIDEVVEMSETVAKTDIAAVVAATIAALRAFSDDIDQREQITEGLVSRLTGATVEAEKLAAAQVTTVSAVARRAEIEALIAVASTMSTPSNFTDLMSDDVAKMQEALKLVVERLSATTGLSYEDGTVSIDVDNVDDDYKPVASTLAELGYTIEDTVALLRQMLALIDVLENVRDNIQDIEAGLNTAIAADAAAPAEGDAGGDEGGEGGEGEGGETTEAGGATENDDGNDDAGGEGDASDDTTTEAGDAGGDEGGEGEAGEQAPEPATAEDICALVCGHATIIATVVNNATTLITGMIELSEMLAEMAGANGEDVVGTTDTGEAGEGGEGGDDAGGDLGSYEPASDDSGDGGTYEGEPV